MHKANLLFLLIAVCLLRQSTTAAFTRAKCKNRESITIYEDSSPELEALRRVNSLRNQMKTITSVQLNSAIDAYIIPSYDEHQTERTEKADRRSEYISGFSGNNAIAVVTSNKAALWTDERYMKQADDEITCDWEIYQAGQQPTITEWLEKELPPLARIGADPTIVPHSMWMRWETELNYNDRRLVKINYNLVDLVWGRNKPNYSNNSIQVHETEYSGEKWQIKINKLRHKIASIGCDAMVVTSLTEIAYILNLRGTDIPYLPVFKAYLIVTANEVLLYTNPSKVTVAVKSFLNPNLCHNKDCVQFKSYYSFRTSLKTLDQAWHKILLPTETIFELGVSEAIHSSIPAHKIFDEVSPIIYMRAQKNDIEQKGMRTAHVRDAVVMCEFFGYFEEKFYAGDNWSEMSVAQTLDRGRRQQNYSGGLAFETIAAFGAHAAQLHYTPSNKTDVEVTENGLLLIDSGGQYLDGTTDVTRTIHLGEPTNDQKRAYTTVLIALIRLASQKFPKNLEAADLDAVARGPLWEELNDYPHGTGHGVGSYLSVHESPISIDYGTRQRYTFEPGYFFSNEPGYYKNGVFGVRLENVLEVIDTGEIHEPSGLPFLAFRDVTLVPFDDKLIDRTLMCKSERKWLNEYNTRIRDTVGEELKKRSLMRAFYWMMNHTRHIPVILPESEYAKSDSMEIQDFSNLMNTVSVLLFFIVKRVLTH